VLRPLESPNSANSPEGQKVSHDKGTKKSGGEGGIRTHVPELPDHPISSRRRYDHFGTSPELKKFSLADSWRLTQNPRINLNFLPLT
jgi:hypothetical protein